MNEKIMSRPKKIYTWLKGDLIKCIEYAKEGHIDYVYAFLGTEDRDKINEQISVICKVLSEYQSVEIQKLLAELHIFILNEKEKWQNQTSSQD